MSQTGITIEWLLEGFKYELAATCRPATVEYYCGEVRRFLQWANATGVPSDIRLITKYHIQGFFHFLSTKCETGGSMSRYIGEILLNIDEKHMSEAEDWIKKAIEADKGNGMMFHLANDYASYAELFKRKGEASRAKENLNKAIKTFKECGADGWVTRAEEALATI